MTRAVVIACALCACNQVLGVHGTTSAASDPDGDGIPSERDNCPEVANANQADRDHDGIGDACDLCPDTFDPTNHDEDGDRRGDVCDVCPNVPDFQLDSDLDGIGDACDDSAAIGDHVGFDSFVTLEPAWTSGGTAWQVVGDAVAPVAALPASDLGLSNPSFAVNGADWSIRATFTAKQRWQAGDEFGIVVLDASGAMAASCMIQCGVPPSSSGCALSMAIPTQPPVVSVTTPSPLVRLAFHSASTPSYTTCDVEGTTARISVYNASFPQVDGTVSLLATPTIWLSSVDVAR
jgi:hypothetical protein